MRQGCVIAATLLVLLIGIGGYVGYTMLRDNFEVPEELAPYAISKPIRQLVHSNAAAPPDTAHLTPERIEMFIGVFDSLNTGWHNLSRVFDSLDTPDLESRRWDLWKSPIIIREAIALPLRMRKGLVAYLNSRNLSLAEYVWLKERTTAASGITYQEAAAVLRDSLHRYLPVPDSSPIDAGKQLTAFFKRVEQIRSSGMIDSSDIALAAPYRQHILRNGIGAFLNPEMEKRP